MSMNMYLFSMPKAEAESLTATHEAFEYFLYDQEIQPEGISGFELSGHWDLMNFLLAGEDAGSTAGRFLASPLMTAGESTGFDTGYGEARLVSDSELAGLCQSLGQLDEPAVLERLNLEKMDRADVYPSVWNSETVPDFDWVMDWVTPLTEFVCSASQKGEILLLALL